MFNIHDDIIVPIIYHYRISLLVLRNIYLVLHAFQSYCTILSAYKRFKKDSQKRFRSRFAKS